MATKEIIYTLKEVYNKQSQHDAVREILKRKLYVYENMYR